MVSIMGVMFPLSPTALAQTDVPTYYEKTTADRERDISLARDFANEYLKNSSEEPAWKGKKPYIASEKFFYTANDAVPSYVEFKVSASDTADAGFIMVNLDAHDVRVPIASPAGKTPSEALESRFEKYHGSSDTEKLYYFSPFDQWMVDENGNAETLNPNNQADKATKEGGKEVDATAKTVLTDEGREQQNAKFAEMRRAAKEFVESDEFKQKSAKIHAQNTLYSYVNPGMSDVLLPFRTNDTNCLSALPCYNQFSFPHWWWNCESGCTPTALAMILIYHDQ